MTELTYSVVADQQAQRIADDLQSEYRAYTAELQNVKEATDRQIEQVAKGYRIDASWITHYANKAEGYQRRIDTLIEISRYVGLTKDQIELALSSQRVWFQTPAEAAEMAEAAAAAKG